jgi:hypothetical protein
MVASIKGMSIMLNGKSETFDGYSDGRVFNSEHILDLATGLVSPNERVGSFKPSDPSIPLDALISGHPVLRVGERWKVMPPAAQLLVKSLAESSVSGDDIIKALKADGVDVSGWNLKRHNTGGWLFNGKSLVYDEGRLEVDEMVTLVSCEVGSQS